MDRVQAPSGVLAFSRVDLTALSLSFLDTGMEAPGSVYG